MVDSTSRSPTHLEPTIEPPPEPETTEEEEIQPPEFPFNIEDVVFQNFRNTSRYPREKIPPVSKELITPPDKASLDQAVKGVTAVMNNEWVHEGEMSCEASRIQTPL